MSTFNLALQPKSLLTGTKHSKFRDHNKLRFKTLLRYDKEKIYTIQYNILVACSLIQYVQYK